MCADELLLFFQLVVLEVAIVFGRGVLCSYCSAYYPVIPFYSSRTVGGSFAWHLSPIFIS